MALRRITNVSQFVELRGTLRLSRPQMPDLRCLLTELRANGCVCAVMFQHLPPDMAVRWRRALAVTSEVLAKIEAHPVLGSMELNSTVVRVTDAPQHSVIELRFEKMSANQALMLDRAALTSSQKIKSEPNRASPTPQPGVLPQLPPQSAPGQRGDRPRISPAAAKLLAYPEQLETPPPPPAEVQAPPGNPPKNQAIVPSHPSWEEAGGASPRRAPLPAQEMAGAGSPPRSPLPAREGVGGGGGGGQKAALPGYEAAAPTDTRPPSHIERPAPRPPQTEQPTVVLRNKKLGEILAHMGKIAVEQVEDAVQKARANGERLGRYLVREGIVSPGAVCRALALQTGLPVTDFSEAVISEKLAKVFPFDLLAEHAFVPFDDSSTFVCVAAASPLPPEVMEELQRLSGRRVEVFLAREDFVEQKMWALRPRAQLVTRKHLRYPCRMQVKYQFCNRFGDITDPTIYDGVTTNISEGGFAVEGPALKGASPEDMLRFGACVLITLALGSPLEVAGHCRVKVILTKNGHWHMGFQILDITEEDRKRLRELCAEAMRQQSAKDSAPETQNC